MPRGRQSSGGSPATARADRRGGKRVAVVVKFQIHGGDASFSGETINVSRSGALLWITDEQFMPPADAINMVRFSERVAEVLGDGVRVEFEGGLAREGEVVRVSRKGRNDRSPMLVACRFQEPLSDDDWEKLGVTSKPLVPVKPPPPLEPSPRKPSQAVAAAKPDEAPSREAERRALPRLSKIFTVEVKGDYGIYQAYALNVSQQGLLFTITDPDFVAPEEPDQLMLFTKRLGFQFRNGMSVRFTEADLEVEAEVAHVTEQLEGLETVVVVGGTFRRALTPAEYSRLEYGHTDAPPVAAPRKSSPLTPPTSAGSSPRYRVYDMLQEAMTLGASDLHLKVGCPPRLRVHGRLKDLADEILTPEQTRAMATELMSPALARRFESEGDVELGASINQVGRFRVSIFKQRGLVGLAIRCIPAQVPTVDSLGISPLACVLADKPRGLVLVTGPTGAGKSHTLAAMVHHINETRDCHILTMEDPIEFLHDDIQAHITQREIGRDATDFASALRRALRQDPDVILVGEMRDLETISLALTAAETGHLVFATLHTSSAAQSPERIVDVFPPSQQEQIRLQLSESLQGVMAQILVPAEKGGLVAAQEILIVNDAARALIRDAKTPQLYNVMQTGGSDGMQTLEAALDRFVKDGVISYETAAGRANLPDQISRPRKRR